MDLDNNFKIFKKEWKAELKSIQSNNKQFKNLSNKLQKFDADKMSELKAYRNKLIIDDKLDPDLIKKFHETYQEEREVFLEPILKIEKKLLASKEKATKFITKVEIQKNDTPEVKFIKQKFYKQNDSFVDALKSFISLRISNELEINTYYETDTAGQKFTAPTNFREDAVFTNKKQSKRANEDNLNVPKKTMSILSEQGKVPNYNQLEIATISKIIDLEKLKNSLGHLDKILISEMIAKQLNEVLQNGDSEVKTLVDLKNSLIESLRKASKTNVVIEVDEEKGIKEEEVLDTFKELAVGNDWKGKRAKVYGEDSKTDAFKVAIAAYEKYVNELEKYKNNPKLGPPKPPTSFKYTLTNLTEEQLKKAIDLISDFFNDSDSQHVLNKFINKIE